MAHPGAPPLPRCVRGIECPPRRATSDKSMPNLDVSHAREGAELDVSAAMRFGRASGPADFVVSSMLRASLSCKVCNMTRTTYKSSTVSLISLFACASVPAPLMPELALTELPPNLGLRQYGPFDYAWPTHDGFLSKSRTLAPFSSKVCAALSPARPPPITIVRGAAMALRLTRKLANVMIRNNENRCLRLISMNNGTPVHFYIL